MQEVEPLERDAWQPLPSLEPLPDLEQDVRRSRSRSPSRSPTAEPEPEPEPAPEAVWTPVPGAEPEPELATDPTDAFSELVIERPEEREPAGVAPEASASALDPEPETGPLPDYIVDPDKQADGTAKPAPPPEPKPEPWQAPTFPGSAAAASAVPEPSLEGLGLPPLTEFPGVTRDRPPLKRTRPQRDPAQRDTAERGTAEPAERPAEPEKKRRRRRTSRSAGEPGDEQEGMGWMDGLSNRLSAYSLADGGEDAADEEADDRGRADERVTARPAGHAII